LAPRARCLARSIREFSMAAGSVATGD
jgi:hypothetical protein